MRNELFFIAGSSPALDCAALELEKLGVSVADMPCDEVTHLLLPVPCQLPQEELDGILHDLPQTVTVLGGRLAYPQLQDYDCMDLLKDETYQAENAMITAYCALNLAGTALDVIWKDCPKDMVASSTWPILSIRCMIPLASPGTSTPVLRIIPILSK